MGCMPFLGMAGCRFEICRGLSRSRSPRRNCHNLANLGAGLATRRAMQALLRVFRSDRLFLASLRKLRTQSAALEALLNLIFLSSDSTEAPYRLSIYRAAWLVPTSSLSIVGSSGGSDHQGCRMRPHCRKCICDHIHERASKMALHMRRLLQYCRHIPVYIFEYLKEACEEMWQRNMAKSLTQSGLEHVNLA